MFLALIMGGYYMTVRLLWGIFYLPLSDDGEIVMGVSFIFLSLMAVASNSSFNVMVCVAASHVL